MEQVAPTEASDGMAIEFGFRHMLHLWVQLPQFITCFIAYDNAPPFDTCQCVLPRRDWRQKPEWKVGRSMLMPCETAGLTL